MFRVFSAFVPCFSKVSLRFEDGVQKILGVDMFSDMFPGSAADLEAEAEGKWFPPNNRTKSVESVKILKIDAFGGGMDLRAFLICRRNPF